MTVWSFTKIHKDPKDINIDSLGNNKMSWGDWGVFGFIEAWQQQEPKTCFLLQIQETNRLINQIGHMIPLEVKFKRKTGK